MRRANPRDEKVLAGGSMHRIIRRAMPYGPPYDPARKDGPRGLGGWFINADIGNQFELIMSQWVNRSDFVMSDPAACPKGTPGRQCANPVWNITGQDVVLGASDPTTSSFTLSHPSTPSARWHNEQLTGFRSFVTTRGGAYCYLPSITALRYITG
jgi:hypothetical protein